MLKIVVLHIIFVETMIHYLEVFFMNRKSKMFILFEMLFFL